MATANMIPITLTKTPLVFLDEKLNIVETSFLHKKICIYIHYNTKRSGTQMYPIFTCVVVFCLWLRYELGKSDKIARKQKERLLELEHDANFTRRQSLDGLHYITFSEKVNSVTRFPKKIVQIPSTALVSEIRAYHLQRMG